MVDSEFDNELPPFPRETPLEILLVRHDARDRDFFPNNGDLSFNSEAANPMTEKLFSRMEDFETGEAQFKSSDGLFHFEVCYPGR